MSAAPSDAAAAAPAPGEKQAARLPGLRGHHKLYLAAVALVAVCVWLIVWLVVFGKVLPDDIVGFAAVVFQVTVKTGVFALLFARYVAGAGTVVAPAAPEGKVGTAPGLRAWAHEAFELDAARTRERGGVDAELHVRRIRMRLACLEVWALLAVPLACVYALDPKRCGWLPERKVVEEEPCTGANPCCGWKDLKKEDENLIEANCKHTQVCKAGKEDYGFWVVSTYEPCCDMLGINYDANDWSDVSDTGVIHHGVNTIPRCYSDSRCSRDPIYEKCEELKASGKECEPVCEVKVKSAGWGRARSPGFDRISLENVLCREGNTATWQLWLAILALYLGHWAAYRIIDAHDEEATETIRVAAEDAPPSHYAVATTGLPEHLREPAELEAFFEGVFERPGAVVRVVPCRHLSAATRSVEKVAGGAPPPPDRAVYRAGRPACRIVV